MDWWPSGIGAVAGFVIGALLAGEQWRLYREPEFRTQPLAGARLLVFRLGLGAACAATTALAFRPDHYDPGPALLTAAWCIVLALVSSTDFERRRIPNAVTYPAILAAILLCWAWPDRSIAAIFVGFGVAVAAGALMYLLGQAMAMFVRSAGVPFGMGDVKLIALIGLLAGWPGIMLVLFAGILLAGIPSLILLARGRTGATFSYGPYLATGAVLGLLFPDRFL